MATATFVHNGDAIDYTPAADVAANSVVVLGDLVCVAQAAIAANKLGTLSLRGVFDFPKATGAGSGIAAGTKLYWDATNKQATATASTNKQLGYAVRAAADGDTAVRAKLVQP